MIPIPQYVSRALRDHIQSQCPMAESGWEYANQDEDTLTGDFFGRMRTDWQTLSNFNWRFYYNKVRGRGKGAMEKMIGADGIITLHYRNLETKNDYYKSLVFQAKKVGNKVDDTQLDKMRAFFPGGNMIVTYGPNEYTCYEDENDRTTKLCQMIATRFLDCTIGIEGLHYDHSDNKFVQPNLAVRGTVNNELLIEVFKNESFSQW